MSESTIVILTETSILLLYAVTVVLFLQESRKKDKILFLWLGVAQALLTLYWLRMVLILIIIDPNAIERFQKLPFLKLFFFRKTPGDLLYLAYQVTQLIGLASFRLVAKKEVTSNGSF